MKKLFGLSFLLALLFAIPVFAGVPVDTDNFPDLAFQEIIKQQKDYDKESNYIYPFDLTNTFPIRRTIQNS